jgi:hypothetical protein
LELCQQWGFHAPVQRIVDLALSSCGKFIRDNGGAMGLEVILVDFDGTVLAQAKGGHTTQSQSHPGEAIPLVQRLSADPVHSYDDESVMGERRQQGSKAAEEQG